MVSPLRTNKLLVSHAKDIVRLYDNNSTSNERILLENKLSISMEIPRTSRQQRRRLIHKGCGPPVLIGKTKKGEWLFTGARPCTKEKKSSKSDGSYKKRQIFRGKSKHSEKKQRSDTYFFPRISPNDQPTPSTHRPVAGPSPLVISPRMSPPTPVTPPILPRPMLSSQPPFPPQNEVQPPPPTPPNPPMVSTPRPPTSPALPSQPSVPPDEPPGRASPIPTERTLPTTPALPLPSTTTRAPPRAPAPPTTTARPFATATLPPSLPPAPRPTTARPLATITLPPSLMPSPPHPTPLLIPALPSPTLWPFSSSSPQTLPSSAEHTHAPTPHPAPIPVLWPTSEPSPEPKLSPETSQPVTLLPSKSHHTNNPTTFPSLHLARETHGPTSRPSKGPTTSTAIPTMNPQTMFPVLESSERSMEPSAFKLSLTEAPSIAVALSEGIEASHFYLEYSFPGPRKATAEEYEEASLTTVSYLDAFMRKAFEHSSQIEYEGQRSGVLGVTSDPVSIAYSYKAYFSMGFRPKNTDLDRLLATALSEPTNIQLIELLSKLNANNPFSRTTDVFYSLDIIRDGATKDDFTLPSSAIALLMMGIILGICGLGMIVIRRRRFRKQIQPLSHATLSELDNVSGDFHSGVISTGSPLVDIKWSISCDDALQSAISENSRQNNIRKSSYDMPSQQSQQTQEDSKSSCYTQNQYGVPSESFQEPDQEDREESNVLHDMSIDLTSDGTPKTSSKSTLEYQSTWASVFSRNGVEDCEASRTSYDTPSGSFDEEKPKLSTFTKSYSMDESKSVSIDINTQNDDDLSSNMQREIAPRLSHDSLDLLRAVGETAGTLNGNQRHSDAIMSLSGNIDTEETRKLVNKPSLPYDFSIQEQIRTALDGAQNSVRDRQTSLSADEESPGLTFDTRSY